MTWDKAFPDRVGLCVETRQDARHDPAFGHRADNRECDHELAVEPSHGGHTGRVAPAFSVPGGPVDCEHELGVAVEDSRVGLGREGEPTSGVPPEMDLL